MKNKILLSVLICAFAFVSCGKKTAQNQQKDTVKKDTVKKTEESKKENNAMQKLGVNIPKGTFTYYGKRKDGYQLIAVELDVQTFKRKAIYFKDVTDKDLQPSDIISDKNQGDFDIIVIKTKQTQKEVKITFPLMGDILINGKSLVPATIFTSNDNRILTSSGAPVFLPFLLGENMNSLEEVTNINTDKQNIKKDGIEYMVYPGTYKGKKIEVLVPNKSTEKFDRLLLVEGGKETVFTNVDN